MTTINVERQTCAVCEQSSDMGQVGSTSSFGAPDLDSRPPMLARETIGYAVQRCPHCGYCAALISRAPEIAPAIVDSPEYRAQLADDAIPELAARFLCAAMVCEASGDEVESSWALINAAWASDDANDAETARGCRVRAVVMARRAIDGGQQLVDQPGGSRLLILDLLRRAGRFEDAASEHARALAADIDPLLSQALMLEGDLISRQDDGCYTIDGQPSTE